MNELQESILWIGAFKYYCGRSGQGTAMFVELVIQSWHGLSLHTRYNLSRDLVRSINDDDTSRSFLEKTIHPLGTLSDRQLWLQLLDLANDDAELKSTYLRDE
jgi:hypothetical protein